MKTQIIIRNQNKILVFVYALQEGVGYTKTPLLSQKNETLQTRPTTLANQLPHVLTTKFTCISSARNSV